MILAYIDESSDAATYGMTALMVNPKIAIPLVNKLDKLVQDASGKYEGLRHDAELHGYDIAWGKNDWKALRGNVKASAELYRAAVEIIASFDLCMAWRSLDRAAVRKKYNGNADDHSVALTFILERIERKTKELDMVALVIADEVGAKQPQYQKDFKWYQNVSTWGWRATKLEHLVDTIHFTPSASSRLLQACDLVSYICYQKTKSHPHPRAKEFYEELWKLLAPRVYEHSHWNPQEATKFTKLS